mmetsp:Transcript_107416/g.321223  ORF Transcript_107416/g.321223 Transcript_107416/m.321223 type:complete len:213 (+) Transcript_107416:998-1636(+)
MHRLALRPLLLLQRVVLELCIPGGLHEVVSGSLKIMLGILQGLGGCLEHQLLPVQVVLAILDPLSSGLLLRLRPVEVAVAEATGSVAAAVVLALGDAGAAPLTASAVGPFLPPTLPEGIDGSVLLHLPLRRRDQRSPRPSRWCRPHRHGEAGSSGGKRQASSKHRTPVLPQPAHPAALPLQAVGEPGSLIRILQIPQEEEALHLRLAGHGAG